MDHSDDPGTLDVIGSGLTAARWQPPPDLRVAVGSQPAGAGTSCIHGLVDGVRILQRAMSQAENAAIMH